MSDQPKPPLSVWLDPQIGQPNMAGGPVPCYGHFADTQQTPTYQGPYVHLEKFMELLTAKVQDISIESEGLMPEECCEAALAEIKQEIEEGKI